MAKFIVEVSDEYIKERGNIDNCKFYIENTDQTNADDMLSVIADVMTFNMLNKEIEEGNTEFYISSKEISEEQVKMFNKMVSVMSVMTLKKLAENKTKD